MEELTMKDTTEAALEETITENVDLQEEENPSELFTVSSLNDDEEGEGGGGYVQEYYSYTVYSDIVPDGVYSLRNLGASTDTVFYYMDVSQGSTSEGAYLQQKRYYSEPATDFVRRSLFKITRYEDTNYYVIRLMTNNYLGFWDDGQRNDNKETAPEYSLKTHEINVFDRRVDIEDTFSITRSGDLGYIIRPYGSTRAIGPSTISAPEANTQYLELQSVALLGDGALWELEKYADVDQADAELNHPALTVGVDAIFSVDSAWTTVPDVAYTELFIDYTNDSIVTGTWNYFEDYLTVNIHQDQTFRVSVQFDSFDVVEAMLLYKAYTPVLPIAEKQYFIHNAELELCMQVADSAKPSYSQDKAIMELRAFDGGAYQKIELQHAADGYYRLFTMCGKVVSVQADKSGQQGSLWQADAIQTNNHTQLWKFLKLSDGTCIIHPKSGEAADFCMAAQAGVTDGAVVEQQIYSDSRGEWNLIPADGSSILFFGVPDPGHTHVSYSHHSGLEFFQSELQTYGFENVFVFKKDVPAASYKAYLKNSKIVIIVCHGGATGNATSSPTSTYIIIKGTPTATDKEIFASRTYQVTDFPNAAAIEFINDQSDHFPNLDMIIFLGCDTGNGGHVNTLPYRMQQKDAKVAIGFEGLIECDDADKWIRAFGQAFASGGNISTAIKAADQEAGYGEQNTASPVRVIGDTTYCLDS